MTVSATPQTATLTVAAAADLSSLEPALGQEFGKANSNVSLRWVTEASAILSQQIENAAPYDVFLSANAGFIDHLASNRKLFPESVFTYATGRLALLWHDGKRHNFKELTANWVRFVGIPDPKLAPYGIAAEEALRHEGLWETIQPKIVYAENVRQTLQLLETGNADAVLTADSLVQGKNPELVPNNWHAPIVQKGGIVAATRNLDAARRFVAFLTSPAGQAVFGKYGFASASK